jgi:hypothetical protein
MNGNRNIRKWHSATSKDDKRKDKGQGVFACMDEILNVHKYNKSHSSF